MKRALVDFWVGGALAAFAGLWTWLVLSTIPAGGFGGAPGPRAFPLLLGALLGILGLILAATSGASVAANRHHEPSIEPVDRDEIAVVGGGFVLFLFYAYLMPRIGFLLATPVVVILALRTVLGVPGWLRISLVAAGLTLGCHVAFELLMQAHLPRGSWVRIGGF